MKKYDSPVLTVKETADYLKVHPSTIYRMLKFNRLPAFRVGADWRFRKADLDEWMRRVTQNPLRVLS